MLRGRVDARPNIFMPALLKGCVLHHPALGWRADAAAPGGTLRRAHHEAAAFDAQMRAMPMAVAWQVSTLSAPLAPLALRALRALASRLSSLLRSHSPAFFTLFTLYAIHRLLPSPVLTRSLLFAPSLLSHSLHSLSPLSSLFSPLLPPPSARPLPPPLLSLLTPRPLSPC